MTTIIILLSVLSLLILVLTYTNYKALTQLKQLKLNQGFKVSMQPENLPQAENLPQGKPGDSYKRMPIKP